ncbi:MAG: methyltransferase domain-containing protein, partial [Candidatus Riflebacteria bacterium]|nr:methyltransferase domain-containing protein [Candidatus Riflebacteria bacterium]
QGFNVIVGRAEALPLTSGSVDIVVSRNSFHMWDPVIRGIQDIFRVLKSGGTVFLGRGFGPDLDDNVRESVKKRRKEYYNRFVVDHLNTEEPDSPDPGAMEAMFRETGFSIVRLIPDHNSYWIMAKK